MKKFDVVIVGAGHNGLVCACYLAKAGLKVGMIERQPFVGGAAISREVWPGYRVSVASYWMSQLQPKIMLDLGLHEHGVEVVPAGPSFQPFESGKSLVFWADEKRMVEEVAQFSRKDAENYPKFMRHLEGLMPFVRRLLFETPVDPSTGRIKDLAKAMGLAWRMRDIGGRIYDLWDILTLSADEYLRRWFESEEMLVAFGSYTSAAGGAAGPRSGASAYALLRPTVRDNTTVAGPSGLVRGGMGTITEALLRVANKLGVEVVTGQIVRKVDIKEGKACGISLDDGTYVAADAVVSNAGAKMTYFDLIGKEHLTEEVIAGIAHYRTKGLLYKINLSCNALPRWTAYDNRRLNEPNPGSITIAENVDEVEEAFRAAHAGAMAPRPYLWITTPSAFDDTVAPKGKHVVQILGGHAPYQLKGRAWDATARQELLAITLKQICRYAPGFDKDVIDAQILTPKDIEDMFWLVGGHVQHGELTLDQIFFRRPIAHYADYRTPVKGMYICSASTHPGGGVTGVPGHNAAREILSDLGRRFPAAKRYT